VFTGIFGLSKLLGNIPASYFVDKYGRKPAMVCGLGLCAAGVGGIGLSLFPGFGTPWLFFCRLLTGFGVSAFTGGSFMYIADISTVLNRTRTFAPGMAAFQGGSALGPAIGGGLVHAVGMGATYGIVGVSFASLALMNYILLPETLDKSTLTPQPVGSGVKGSVVTETKIVPAGIDTTNSFPSIKAHPNPNVMKIPNHDNLLSICQKTLSSWRQLLTHTNIRDIVSLNCAYWMTISGVQMTLLPLFMVDPLHLHPSQIGISFAVMSIISVLSSYKIASLADHVGKIEMTILGALLVTGSVMCVPFATTFVQLIAILAPLALGSTAISAIPQAYISDLTLPHQRSNAMALLRAGGDIGLLVGAILTGVIAQYSSVFTAIQLNGCVMLLAVAAFTLRSKQLFKHRQQGSTSDVSKPN